MCIKIKILPESNLRNVLFLISALPKKVSSEVLKEKVSPEVPKERTLGEERTSMI